MRALTGLEGADAFRPVQRAHRAVEMAQHVRHAVGHRRIDAAGLVEPGFDEMRVLGGQHRLGEDLALLGVGALGAEDDLGQFLEIEQPVRQAQPVVRAQHTACSAKARAYSLCGSSSMTWAFGLWSITARRIVATAQDLPEPVVPTMLKCLPIRSSISR